MSTVLDARLVVDACMAVHRGAAETVAELEQELSRRAAAHSRAAGEHSAAAHRFDVDESPESAAAFGDAVRALDSASLLVQKTRERLETARGSLATAEGARSRAERDLHVVELRESIDAPIPFGAVPRALDAALRVHAAPAVGPGDVARRALHLAEAVEALRAALAPIWNRADEDVIASRELGALGVAYPAPCVLHAFAPVLAHLFSVGRLNLDTRGTWNYVRRQTHAACKLYSETLTGFGPLTEAHRSLVPLRRALESRDAGAIVDALAAVGSRNSDRNTVRKIVAIIGEHRTDHEIVAAVGAIERVDAEAFQATARAKAIFREESALAAADKRAAEWRKGQARMGNDHARKQLGIDGLPIHLGGKLPEAPEHPVVRAAATVGTFLDKAVAAITK